jgi:hypothetical protein
MRIIEILLLAAIALYIAGIIYFIYSDSTSKIMNIENNPIDENEIENIQRDLLNKPWNDLRIRYDAEGYIIINETSSIIDSPLEVVVARYQSSLTYTVQFQGDPQITRIFREIHNVSGDIVIDTIEEIFTKSKPEKVERDIINNIEVEKRTYIVGKYRLTLFVEPRTSIPLKIIVEFDNSRITLTARSIGVF